MNKKPENPSKSFVDLSSLVKSKILFNVEVNAAGRGW